MAGFKARGSIVQFKWQETPEGREFLGGILHRNRRKSFGLLETPSLPPQLSVETASFKIVLTGKPGVGKTSTVAKLLGQGESSTVGKFQSFILKHLAFRRLLYIGQ
ncbi:PREDICTED: REM2- and Rab-like small GTPase 1 [Acropora digitifera]|uniref:REM2- and Rab-like small GTPase 1 n=1 Tax=Acropora digitifera TaxID=70779 RepID=UPI00077A195E|nr:PREDICTED: REM2- and Rab-like small GTPase 1 [Acropora digitifera]